MKRVFIVFILCLITVGVSAQKTRVLSVLQMIEQKKYEEAKEAVELAVWNDKTSSWAKTYYVRGLLCQTAFEDGFEKNETKKTALYPDQLYLAFSSYERALELDTRNRHKVAISQQYYLLSNDFRKLGKRHFQDKEFEKAQKAFEQALIINKSPLIHAKVDTNLIYNTAMAAYESKNWDKAIGYLTGLHENGYGSSSSLILYQALLEKGDTARAEEVLSESLGIYNYDTQVVFYLINLLDRNGDDDKALEVFNRAIQQSPDNYKFHWGQGLIYRKIGEPDRAVESFKAALKIAPEESMISYHIGLIYYNQGIDLTEQSLRVKDIDDYNKIKAMAREHFTKAVYWMEQAYELDPYDEETISKLHQLYYQLQMKEKEESMKLLID